MEPLRIAPAKSTFRVDFDPQGRLELTGSSYPEDAVAFFAPLRAWLQAYLAAAPERTALRLQVDYVNTSSSKCLLDLLDLLEARHRAGGGVRVEWLYDADDEDMRELGEELAEDLTLEFAPVAVGAEGASR
jgi:hypothetical protein